ncbi:MAG: histidine phosphatase family protein [bacterium]|nr:histidine phosphatase family protein [bacterium]
MRKLIVVRHGFYGLNGHLNELGRSQISGLAQKLPAYLEGLGGLIICSPFPRTRESADILGTSMGFGIEESEVLFVDRDHKPNFPGVWKLIKRKEGVAEILLLVAHLEHVEEFPNYFGIKEWSTPLGVQVSDYASAFIIDCLTKSLAPVL